MHRLMHQYVICSILKQVSVYNDAFVRALAAACTVAFAIASRPRTRPRTRSYTCPCVRLHMWLYMHLEELVELKKV